MLPCDVNGSPPPQFGTYGGRNIHNPCSHFPKLFTRHFNGFQLCRFPTTQPNPLPLPPSPHKAGERGGGGGKGVKATGRGFKRGTLSKDG